MDNVTKQADTWLGCWRDKLAIGIILLARESQGNVIFSLWETRCFLVVIGEDIEACLAKIGVFSSVINGVVVIPEGASSLGIRVIVVLVVANWNGIFCPSIPGWVSYTKSVSDGMISIRPFWARWTY